NPCWTWPPSIPPMVAAVRDIEELYRASGRPEDELAVRQQIIAIRQGALGPDHPDTLSAHQGLVALLTRQCRDEEANALNREILPKILSRWVENFMRHAETVEKRGSTPTDVLIDAGDIYVKLERLTEARQAYDRAMQGLVEQYTKHRWVTPVTKSIQ